MFKFRTFYQKDLESPAIQRNLNNTIRLGRITGINTQAGTCVLEWFDRPGFRSDVILTQSSSNSFFIPKKGTIVLVGFDSKEQARILQYIPVGHATKVQKLKTLPKFKEGDSYIEGGGSYIYIRANGDVVITTSTESYLLLENSSGTLKSETTNWKALTQAGFEYLGLIKRFKINLDGTSSLKLIQDNFMNYLTEYNLKVLETADNDVNAPGLENPIVSITFGTVVDQLGNIIMKNNLPAETNITKQLAARIALKSGIEIDIDKSGRISILNVNININGGQVDTADTDIALGLEIASTTGTRGQHVAREHDPITVPLGTSYTDSNHTTLASKGLTNINTLITIIKNVIATYQVSGVQPGAGMIPLSPSAIPYIPPTNTQLQGEVTGGANNVYVGDV